MMSFCGPLVLIVLLTISCPNGQQLKMKFCVDNNPYTILVLIVTMPQAEVRSET